MFILGLELFDFMALFVFITLNLIRCQRLIKNSHFHYLKTKLQRNMCSFVYWQILELQNVFKYQ